MKTLISIDPGKTTGYASFSDAVLLSAGTAPRADLFAPVTRDAYGRPTGALPFPLFPLETLVLIELPRWYPHDHTDVNDLIDLAVLVGEIKRHYEAMDCVVELVWPRTWKGSAPKDVTNRRTVAALSEVEESRLPVRPRARTYDHNMLDAVGLGLWELGRLV